MSDPGEEKDFREYLTSAGGFVHEGLTLLADDPSKGRKVVATSDIAIGTELLKVPVNTCFSASPTGPARQVDFFRSQQERPMQLSIHGSLPIATMRACPRSNLVQPCDPESRP